LKGALSFCFSAEQQHIPKYECVHIHIGLVICILHTSLSILLIIDKPDSEVVIDFWLATTGDPYLPLVTFKKWSSSDFS
jgi:hypothetical protein